MSNTLNLSGFSFFPTLTSMNRASVLASMNTKLLLFRADFGPASPFSTLRVCRTVEASRAMSYCHIGADLSVLALMLLIARYHTAVQTFLHNRWTTLMLYSSGMHYGIGVVWTGLAIVERSTLTVASTRHPAPAPHSILQHCVRKVFPRPNGMP